MKRYQHSSYTPRSLKRLEKNSRKKLIYTIIFSLVLLYFLLAWGLPMLVGSLSVFNKFKPISKTPTGVEDSAITPPILNIPYEATSSAIIKINGYSSPNSKVEIYIDDDLKSATNTNDDGSFTTDDIELNIGTNNIYGKTINDKGNKSLPSKNIKLIYNNEKPKLEVSEPEDNKQIKGGDKKVRVSGKTDSTNSVTINGSVVILNGDGSFGLDLPINDGDNTITVISTNSVGNSTKIERKVNYSAS